MIPFPPQLIFVTLDRILVLNRKVGEIGCFHRVCRATFFGGRNNPISTLTPFRLFSCAFGCRSPSVLVPRRLSAISASSSCCSVSLIWLVIHQVAASELSVTRWSLVCAETCEWGYGLWLLTMGWERRRTTLSKTHNFKIFSFFFLRYKTMSHRPNS